MRRNNYRQNTIEKTIDCSCGSKAKLGSRRNYPFGKKSKPIRTIFYKCKSCGKVSILSKDNNGGRR